MHFRARSLGTVVFTLYRFAQGIHPLCFVLNSVREGCFSFRAFFDMTSTKAQNPLFHYIVWTQNNQPNLDRSCFPSRT